jgi:hypothetical protein
MWVAKKLDWKGLKKYMQRKSDVIPTNEESFHQTTREIRKTIPIEAVMALDEPITMDELWDSINRGKRNKAAGEDGINHKFLK